MANEVLDLIPFGKYKGQPISALSADPQYCEWLSNQDWFRERYSKVYSIIINNFVKPEDTPEHNQIQALFLKEDFIKKILRFVFPIDQCIDHYSRENSRCESDPHYGRHYEREKIKSDLQKMQQGDMSFLHIDKGFEEHGVDVKLKIRSYLYWVDILFEIKPSIGDDYPSILRQIHANWMQKENSCGSDYYLLYDNFTATGVTESEMKSMFQISGIGALSLSEILNSEES